MSLLAFLCALFVSPLSPAVPDVPPSDTTAPLTLEAHAVDTPPRMDGVLREAAWADAPSADGFRQLEPEEGGKPSQPTDVRVLYGRDALYVGAVMHDDRPGRIRDRLTRRDNRNQADWFEVSIDSYLDRQTARTFAVNAAGVQRDGIVRSGTAAQRGFNASWDAIWRSAVRITDRGWVAELRIPYDMLRFSEADRQTWGLQFRRRIPRTDEVLEWPLVPFSERQGSLVAEYGRLVNLQNLNPSRRLQVTPYTLGRVRTQEEAGAPGTLEATSTADVGANLEVGVGPNATLEATLNPDFGQVESDPSVLNLLSFDPFFPEKRPFFVEGTDLFDFPLGVESARGQITPSELFYSRRIGAEAPVIGALKLSGRSRGDLSYGVLGAATGADLRPNRYYGVGRLEQALGPQSTVGGLLTVYDGPRAGGKGRRRSIAGGMDWELYVSGGTHRIDGSLSATHRRTTASSTSPTTGWGLQAVLERLQGTWVGGVETRIRDPDFNPNDVGRLRRNNQIRFSGVLRRQVEGGPFRTTNGFLFLGQSWSYDRRLDRGAEAFLRVRSLTDGFRPLTVVAEGRKLFGGVDLFETRGLWPRVRPSRGTGRLSLGTDTRRSWQLTANLSGTARTDGGRAWSAGLDVEWNVGSRLKLSGSLSFREERGVVEWAANETFVRRDADAWAIGTESTSPSALDADDLRPLDRGTGPLASALSDVPAAGTAIGGHPTFYVPVYGRRDTERLNLTLRSNVALTKDLSFEFFGQLFGARGQYRDFQILSSRNDLDAFPAYPRRHDFARSSFIANAVLRWEFRPGSELFVVWSQDRRLRRTDPFFRDQRAGSPYNRSTGRRLTDAFRDVPQNAFIVKLRYTIR